MTMLKIKPEPVIESEERNKDCVYIPIVEINTLIVCPLCAGYLVNATRIAECHHVFCKSCIVLYLHEQPMCPVCFLEIENSLPLNVLVGDTIYQDVVNKLLPDIYDNEKNRIMEFYEKRSQIRNGGGQNPPTQKRMIEIKLTPLPKQDPSDFFTRPLNTPLIRCEPCVLVHYICALIRKTAGIPKTHAIPIYCGRNLLSPTDSLETVMYAHWNDKSPPLEMKYRIVKVND